MKIITAIKSWLFREKHSAHHWRKYLSETSLLGCRDTKTPAGRLGLMRPTMGGRGLCGQAGGQNLCSTWAGCVLPAPVRPLGFCPPLAPSCWQPVGQPCHQAPSTPATKHQAPPGLVPMRGQLLKGCGVPRACNLWWTLSMVASGMAWQGRGLGDTHWY